MLLQLFTTRDSDYVFTVHFSYMQTEEHKAGMVEVRWVWLPFMHSELNIKLHLGWMDGWGG